MKIWNVYEFSDGYSYIYNYNKDCYHLIIKNNDLKGAYNGGSPIKINVNNPNVQKIWEVIRVKLVVEGGPKTTNTNLKHKLLSDFYK